jgi:hypothetical protein
MAQNDQALLRRLQQHEVQFVIIGGVCATLHGVSLVTLDLDICCPFSVANLRRIEQAVKDLHPIHRLAANKLPLELTDELCARLKNMYLKTDLGILDCLSEVAGIGSFEEVKKCSVIQKMYDSDFAILSLDALIAAKQAVARERDLEAVRQLLAIKERQQQDPGPS